MESGKPTLNRAVRSFRQQGGFAEIHLNDHLKRTLTLIQVIVRYVNQSIYVSSQDHAFLCMTTEHRAGMNPVEEAGLTLSAVMHINKIKPLE